MLRRTPKFVAAAVGGLALIATVPAPLPAATSSQRSVTKARSAGLSGNPFLGAKGYVDPTTEAAVAERQATGHRRALLRRIARRPVATWLGNGYQTSARAKVHRLVRRQRRAGAMPVLVLYNIPGRDCGSYSAGGLPDATAYVQWIDRVARGIGSATVVADLEPDSLGGLDCLTHAEAKDREQTLAAAVVRLDEQPGVSVYLDGGNEGWHPAGVMARRLRAAGVANARGFSLNVSSFYRTSTEEHYGNRIVARLHHYGHFIIDTSRNGRGPAPGHPWCNPSERGLGTPLTTDTGNQRTDALLWLKPPGESDGTCNGGPPAGVFWTSYALGLSRRANL